jgi:hypothetical protein
VNIEGCHEQVLQLRYGEKKLLQNFGGYIMKCSHMQNKYSWRTILMLNLTLKDFVTESGSFQTWGHIEQIFVSQVAW